MPRASSDTPGPVTFPSTHWSQLDAGDERARERALARLAEAYQHPVRAWLASALGCTGDEARELFQDFFVWVIESGFLAKADRARGSFRAFLKTALRHYGAKAHERAAAQKRGGAARFVPLEHEAEDGAFELRDARARTPEQALDDAWKAEVVQAAIERTRADCEQHGRAVVFAVFREWYLEPGDARHADTAARHGIATGDVSNYLRRAKELYRAHLRAIVLESVGSLADLEGELAWLAGSETA